MIRKAELPAGVIGRTRPWARVKQKWARVPPARRSGNGYSVVIGRDWVSQSAPAPSIAHSMSCGTPNRASTRRPSATSAAICASVRLRPEVSSLTSSVPPPARGRMATILSPSRYSAIVPSPSTTMWSGLTAPDTTASPSPGAASMTVRVRRPVSGSAVNSTPASSASSMRCTTTDSATSWWSMPASVR